ncbi:TetR/AcrR family transcriptional regulator [Mycolicibacterium thermoresistibile]
MTSIRNGGSVEDRILDAAAAAVLAVGVTRVTLTDIARRARVSRPTIYRRWPDIDAVLASLLTTRITAVLDEVPRRGADREALVERIVAIAERLRADEVVMSVLYGAPEFTMVYITDRLGSSQRIVIEALATEIAAAQDTGTVRAGDPQQLAAMCALIAQSAVQSARMVEPILDADALAAELTYSLNGYLKP